MEKINKGCLYPIELKALEDKVSELKKLNPINLISKEVYDDIVIQLEAGEDNYILSSALVKLGLTNNVNPMVHMVNEYIDHMKGINELTRESSIKSIKDTRLGILYYLTIFEN